MQHTQDFAIVGIGGVFPGARDLDAFWDNIIRARDLSREPPEGRWLLSLDDVLSRQASPDKVYSRRACFVDDFPLNTDDLAIDKQYLEALDPMYQLLLHAGRQAWLDANVANINKQRVGIIIGNIALPTDASSALADEILLPVFERQIFEKALSQKQATHRINRYVAGLPAGLLARSLGLGGGSYTLDAACASSLYALKYAVDELQTGRADAMLAGGLSRPDSLYTQMGFSALTAISASGHCSPFDHKADGLMVGEGSGMVLLKRLDDALNDGDQIYATIRGIGLSNDIGGNIMSPDSEGQLRAMRSAYELAGWQPDSVDLIECHGTGTPVGDATEFHSLKTLWGNSSGHRAIIGSVKSNIGHLLTAAGSAGLIKVLMAIKNKTLPPTANFEQAASKINLADSSFNVLSEAEPWQSDTPRRAAVSAFGFGGINGHVLLEEWTENETSFLPAAKTSLENTDIAIVGMDACFGPWQSLQAFRQRVLGQGNDTLAKDLDHCWGIETDVKGYIIDKVDIPLGRFRIPPTELLDMLPQQLLMLQVAANAMEDAGIEDNKEMVDAGVYVGIGLDLNTTNFHLRWKLLNKARQWARELKLDLTKEQLQQWVEKLRDAASPPLSANRTMGALGGIVASRVARAFNVGGPSFTLSNEEASGLRALAAGMRALQGHDINTAIVGAVDLAADIRAVMGQYDSRPYNEDREEKIVGEGAAALILKRHEDAIRDGDRIYAVIKGVGEATGGKTEATLPSMHDYCQAARKGLDDAGISIDNISLFEIHGSGQADEDEMETNAIAKLYSESNNLIPCALGNTKADIGHTGAAGGLASIIKTSLCLYYNTIPSMRGLESLQDPVGKKEKLYAPQTPQYWLRNKSEGPRHAMVNAFSIDGNSISAILADADTTPLATTNTPAALFSVEANDQASLLLELETLEQSIKTSTSDLQAIARQYWQQRTANNKLAISLIAEDKQQLLKAIKTAIDCVNSNRAISNDSVFYNPQPLGRDTRLAFVYPGSGNHFYGMGREAATYWPKVLDMLDDENDHLASQFAESKFWSEDNNSELSHKDVIFGQVWLGTMMSDVVASFGIKPGAIIGYSLGETAGLFATRTWTDRDLMLERIRQSTLFTDELAGPCNAVRKTWGLGNDEEVDWQIGVINCPSETVKEGLKGRDHVYLLIINTANECVIGGDKKAVRQLANDLDCHIHLIKGVTTVHCEVAKPVEKPYRDLHLFDTNPPEGVTFYSGIFGGAYAVTRDSAADSIVGQALHYFDYTRVINNAYEDGVRIFIEMGPGNTCSRMIDQILEGKDHIARAVCVKGQSEVINVLHTLAQLNTERIPLDLSSLYFDNTVVDPYADHKKISVAVGKEAFDVPMPPTTGLEIRESGIGVRESGIGVRESGIGVRESGFETRESGSEKIIDHPVLARQSDDLMSEIIDQMASTEVARAEAQEMFLKVANGVTETMAQALSLQSSLLQTNTYHASILSDQFSEAYPEQRVPTTPGKEEVENVGNKFSNPATIAFDRSQCMEFAIGSIAKMLGPQFAEVDNYPTRVRLPDEPLMLADRIMEIHAEPCSMSHGSVVTEHDIHADAWYLDCGRIPTCIAVEAGQADLFLSGYLGIDLETKGLAVYRLLDAEVTLHGPLPEAGKTIRYDIHIDHFFRQGDTYLFRFYFDGTVDGQTLITMRNGCAGFFSQAELDAGQGIVQTSLEKQTLPGKRDVDWRFPVKMARESYSDVQINALREGRLADCFGPGFEGLPLDTPVGLPSGRMTLVHRVLDLDPKGGRFGIGQITGEADIHPDDWFLTCHFVDDRVMPGTLMYECCLHTLRVYLLRMGWVCEADEIAYEPVLEVGSKLKCRGQVLDTTQKVQYEITLKEYGYRDDGAPYVIADALMYADGRAIVQMTDMSLQLSGLTKDRIDAIWQGRTGQAAKTKQVLFDYDSILAFATGKPSEAFGDKYKVFDDERVIARLPGPPFQVLDRIVAIKDCEQWTLVSGGVIEAEYDVPDDAWYFDEGRQPYMPFAVLLETALQPCGWLAAYLGSALSSDEDLSFRNLGGMATQHRMVTADTGTLTTTVKITNVSSSGGMIIQHYDYHLRCSQGDVYSGNTYFGFFTKSALADQIGIRDAQIYQPSAEEKSLNQSIDYPNKAPFPKDMLRMIDEVSLFVPEGGPHGQGFIQGISHVNADDWFYKAHFYQDPVWPGSLGLESFVQLLKFVAWHHWGDEGVREILVFESMPINESHSWIYRGQILPTDGKVTVEAVITELDHPGKRLRADGFLTVDGRIIYQMKNFRLRIRENSD